MPLEVKMRLLELDYLWDEINRTHKLTWDTDYPVNLNGSFVKVFVASHPFTSGDHVTLNDVEYEFTDLRGNTAKTNAFTLGQYVPIVIDIDAQKIMFFSPAGAGSGSGEVIEEEIEEGAWHLNNNTGLYEVLIESPDINKDMLVFLNPHPQADKEERTLLTNYAIDGEIVSSGVKITAAVCPWSTVRLQIIIL